jgi:hypothetical protein
VKDWLLLAKRTTLVHSNDKFRGLTTDECSVILSYLVLCSLHKRPYNQDRLCMLRPEVIYDGISLSLLLVVPEDREGHSSATN